MVRQLLPVAPLDEGDDASWCLGCATMVLAVGRGKRERKKRLAGVTQSVSQEGRSRQAWESERERERELANSCCGPRGLGLPSRARPRWTELDITAVDDVGFARAAVALPPPESCMILVPVGRSRGALAMLWVDRERDTVRGREKRGKGGGV